MVTRIRWEYLELVGSSFDSGTFRDIQKRLKWRLSIDAAPKAGN